MLKHAKAEQMCQASEQKILQHFVVYSFQAGESSSIAAQSTSQNFPDEFC